MWRRGGWLLGPCLAGLAILSPGAAAAGPTSAADGTTSAAARPTSVAVNGPGLPEGFVVRDRERPDRCKALLAEVDWLANRPGNAPNPDPASLGPKYQLVVLIDEAPEQTYDAYPLAAGGPRVFRPAEQPKRKVAAAWFYGRVSMPETLRDAGVPLAAQPLDPSGGEGGGEAVPAGTGADQANAGTDQAEAGAGQRRAGADQTTRLTGTPEAGPDIDEIIWEWQRQMLILAGGALLLLLMLGLVSRLVRRG